MRVQICAPGTTCRSPTSNLELPRASDKLVSMDYEPLYHERTRFRFAIIMAVFFALIAAAMLGLLVYHFAIKLIDETPGIGWLFLTEFAVMTVVAIVVAQFSHLDVVLTYQAIIIKFGRIQKSIPWTDVQAYHTVTEGRFLTGGGFHLGAGRRGWYAEYTVLGKPRVVLSLNTGRIRRVIFSSANPQEIARIIKKQTGKDESQ